MEPLVIADAMNRLSKVDISITTNGGGIMGQTDAIRTAIARGLVHYNGGAEGIDEELRDEYLRFDRSLLVNDPRRKEPKHQLGRGARRKKQKSYRISDIMIIPVREDWMILPIISPLVNQQEIGLQAILDQESLKRRKHLFYFHRVSLRASLVIY